VLQLEHTYFMAKDKKELKNTQKYSKQKTTLRSESKRSGEHSDQKSISLKDETKHGIYAVISFVLALFFILAAFNGGGRAGIFFYSLFAFLFGVGYVLVPILCIMLGISFVRSVRPNVGWSHTLSSLIFLLSCLGLIDIASGSKHVGGYIGKIAAFPFLKLFDVYTSILFLGALLLISIFILFDSRPSLLPLVGQIANLFKKRKDVVLPEIHHEPIIAGASDATQQAESEKKPIVEIEKEPAIQDYETKKKEKTKKEDKLDEMTLNFHDYRPATNYVPPPLDLLEEDRGKPNTGDVKASANIIKRTLQNFGIEVEMDEITIGPTVTRYAVKPAEGVRLSRIAGLQNDLALALAAHPIRIEAPIPGKSLVGIEVPNKTKATVGLASLFRDEKFSTAQKPLMLALGRAISGRSQVANLAKMPHVLIAGTTGSGKSVTIHTIIASLLYRNGPEALRLIMVDPKRVELTLYKGIPHLLTPVITDPKKAILALRWAANEMSRRYDILEKETCRDIESYHTTVVKNGPKEGPEAPERMPYIVIIIDELADIMTSYPRELEAGIVRLAQMSRAVGIHLILSTQRPEVNVITGLIKANVPARIALKVASQIDSRTILDAGGAEKLLGAGDMLYLSGESQPERLQSAYITEGEVKKIVKYLTEQYRDIVMDEINLQGGISADRSAFEATLDGDSSGDELYEDARQIVIEAQKASSSFLQRKLGIGYSRAAKLIDMLEERGVISAGIGNKPRDVIEKPTEMARADFAGGENTEEIA
jgi:S-DNA-T family DNA segregation ATPase FtsK/SpoIIIE